MAADSQRAEHVSRARLFADGSVLARQLQEQRQLQQDAPAEQLSEPLRAAQITWPELWDARTTAAFVGAQMGEEDTQHKSMQLWWPPQNAPGRGQQQRQLKRKHTRLLHYSAVMARTLQRSGGASTPKQQQTGSAAASGITLSLTQPAQLFGRVGAKRQRMEEPLQQQGQAAAAATAAGAGGQEPAAPWVCCNSLAVQEPSSQDRAVLCGASNAAAAWCCCECGAARWDGPDGQLQQRITAALQTADLDLTNIRQVAARVMAEAGSRPGVGLTPQAGMQAEVLAVVHDRQAVKAAAAAAGAAQPTFRVEQLQGTRGGAAGGEAAGGAGGLEGAADTLQLLDDCGCLPEAHGVFTNLLTWLQQQQQQQQQGPEGHHPGEAVAGSPLRLQSAAAAAAALAPGLLAGVLQQQGGLPAVKLAPGAVMSWVHDCFEEAAAAAVRSQACTQPQQQQEQQQQGSARRPGQPCLPLRRPLPLHTTLALCDRRGASLQQQLVDVAAAAVAACGGQLPLITRSYSLEGEELLSHEAAPREWLWAGWAQDTVATRVLRAHEGGARAADHEGDLWVEECITSPHWEEVLFVRARVHHLLSAWCDTLGEQTAHGQQQQQQQQQPLQHALDRQLRQLLVQQVQRVRTAWGSAPPYALRQGLTTQQQGAAGGMSEAATGLLQQQGQLGQAAGIETQLPRRSNRQQRAQQQALQRRRQQQQQLSGQQEPSAAAGVRRSARLQAQSVSLSGGGQPSGTGAPARPGGSRGSSTSGSSDESGGGDSEGGTSRSGSSSGSGSEFVEDEEQSSDGSRHRPRRTPSSGHHRARSTTTGSGSHQQAASSAGIRQRHQQQESAEEAEGQQPREVDEARAVLDAWLDSLDDLLLPQGVGAAAPTQPAAAVDPGKEVEPGQQPGAVVAWQPRASSQWQWLKRGPEAALTAADGTAGCSGGAGCRRGDGAGGGEGLLPGLPAGMQLVLSQATRMGVAPQVLQRTAVRLAKLLHRDQGVETLC